MRPIPHGHPRTIRRLGDHRIELIFLSTQERDEVYELLLKDLDIQYQQPKRDNDD